MYRGQGVTEWTLSDALKTYTLQLMPLRQTFSFSFTLPHGKCSIGGETEIDRPIL